MQSSPVDIIVAALGSDTADMSSTRGWHQTAVSWVNENKAPVLALDPPLDGGGVLDIKWSMTGSLPLSYSKQCGQVYLSDLGIPREIYQEVGIVYHSPFINKFVIPLYDP